jgi:hypothetical protein
MREPHTLLAERRKCLAGAAEPNEMPIPSQEACLGVHFTKI